MLIGRRELRAASAVSSSNSGSLGILKRQTKFLGERIDRRSLAFPGALRLEAQIADPSAPWRNHPPYRTKIGTIRVLLVQPPNHIRRDADKRPKRGGALDAV